MEYEIPYGLKVAGNCSSLEENPSEIEVMLEVLEGLVADRKLSEIADSLNLSGRVRRNGEAWTQVAVFELLPRLIEFSPHVFGREKWLERRKKLRLAV